MVQVTLNLQHTQRPQHKQEQHDILSLSLSVSKKYLAKYWLNRSGEITPPCFTPLEILNSSDLVLLHVT